MAVNVNDKIRKLSAAQRKKVEARAAALIAEEMTLRELRKARKLTQVRMAKALGVTQDSVSRLEKRSDLLLSTLRKTVKAMGGSLSLVAEFPDRAPVVLSGIADDEPAPKPTGRKHVHAHASSRNYA
jgi:transcriptional regulator with XRE-family HTH domain